MAQYRGNGNVGGQQEPSPIGGSGRMRRRRRWPWVLGGLFAILLVALAIAASQLESWVNARIQRELPRISEVIGRPVRVGSVHLSLLTGAAVEVRDVEVSPDPAAPAGTVPPALQLARARVNVGVLWTLLSLGRRLRVDELAVEGLAIHATKRPDGRLDWQDMAERWQAANPPKAEEPEEKKEGGPDEDTLQRLRKARLGKLRINVSRLSFSDIADPAQKAEIRDVNLSGDDIGLDRSFALAAEAALLSPRKNFELRVAFNPAAETEGQLTPPPVKNLEVRLDRMQLGPLAPFLVARTDAASEQVPSLERGSVEFAIAVQPGAAMEGGSGPTLAKVNFLLAGAQFAGGDAFDARLQVDASANVPAGDLEVRTFTASLAEMAIEARGSLHALRSAPRFEGFVVTSKGLNFDRLQRIKPSPAQGVRLGGPFSLNAKAGGDIGAQRFEGKLDFTTASMAVGGSFAKPAGTPFVISATGSAEGDTVKLDPFAVAIADWQMSLRGTLSQLSQNEPVVDLKLQTDAPGIAGLARLLPPVANSTPAGSTIAGSIAVDGAVRGKPSDMSAKADVLFSNMAVRAPDTQIQGQGTIHLEANKKANSMDAKLAVDLSGLGAVYQDLVRKPSGSPLVLNANVTQTKAQLKAEGQVRMTGLAANGRATIEGDPGKEAKFHANADVSELGVRSLMAMVPSASNGQPLPDAHITMQVNARGVIGRPESMHVELSKFTLESGKSDLAANATLDNPSQPRVTFDAHSRYLDLDELLPKKSEGKAKRDGGAKAPAEKPDPNSPLMKASGQVKLAVKAGRVSKIDFQDLAADLRLDAGRLLARTLEVKAFGGTFSGSGTDLPLAEPERPVGLKGKVSNLDIDAVIAHFGDGRDLLRGKLSANIDLRSRGTDPVAVQETLTGLVGGKLTDAEFVPADLVASIMGPLEKAVSLPGFGALRGAPAKAEKLQKSNGWQLGDVVGEARVKDGSVAFTKPLTAATPSGPLSLTGQVLLQGKADLTGQLNMSPAAATALTGGKVKIDNAVPVTVTVTGPLRRPSIRPSNLDAVAKMFAKAYLASEGGRALQDKLGKGAKALLDKTGLGNKLPGGAAGAVADPGATARKLEEEARAKAEAARAEQAARAQAEADAARKRAEDEARARTDKAKENATGKLRGILGK